MKITSPHSPESIFSRHHWICKQQCNSCNCAWRVWHILRQHHLTAEHCLANPDTPIPIGVFDEIERIPIDARSVRLDEHDWGWHVAEIFAPMRDFLSEVRDEEV